MRIDKRNPDQLRPVNLIRDFVPSAEGSVLIEVGNTRVICTATLESGVPKWLKGGGSGWLTAEYAMIPRATEKRTPREVNRGRASGRTLEIQRMIGRSLRAVTRLDLLGENTIYLDCDVIQADGGTRTASISGAYVALALACQKLLEQGLLKRMPLKDSVAAVSVGIVDGHALLDLNYPEDSRAGVDMNVVMTGSGRYIEVQSTAEGEPFPRECLDELLQLACIGIDRLTEAQQTILKLDFAKA